MKRMSAYSSLVLLLAPATVAAQGSSGSSINSPQKALELLDTIARWMYGGILALAVIFILLAAYNFLWSGGDTARVEKARNQLLYTAVAVGVEIHKKKNIKPLEKILK